MEPQNSLPLEKMLAVCSCISYNTNRLCEKLTMSQGYENFSWDQTAEDIINGDTDLPYASIKSFPLLKPIQILCPLISSLRQALASMECMHGSANYKLIQENYGIQVEYYCSKCDANIQKKLMPSFQESRIQCSYIHKLMKLFTTPCRCGKEKYSWKKKICQNKICIYCDSENCKCSCTQNVDFCNKCDCKLSKRGNSICYKCQLFINANIDIVVNKNTDIKLSQELATWDKCSSCQCPFICIKHYIKTPCDVCSKNKCEKIAMKKKKAIKSKSKKKPEKEEDIDAEEEKGEKVPKSKKENKDQEEDDQ